jgi:hypothetical protein
LKFLDADARQGAEDPVGVERRQLAWQEVQEALELFHLRTGGTDSEERHGISPVGVIREEQSTKVNPASRPHCQAGIVAIVTASASADLYRFCE